MMSRNGVGASAPSLTMRIRPRLLDDEEAVRGAALGAPRSRPAHRGRSTTLWRRDAAAGSALDGAGVAAGVDDRAPSGARRARDRAGRDPPWPEAGEGLGVVAAGDDARRRATALVRGRCERSVIRGCYAPGRRGRRRLLRSRAHAQGPRWMPGARRPRARAGAAGGRTTSSCVPDLSVGIYVLEAGAHGPAVAAYRGRALLRDLGPRPRSRSATRPRRRAGLARLRRGRRAAPLPRHHRAPRAARRVRACRGLPALVRTADVPAAERVVVRRRRRPRGARR